MDNNIYLNGEYIKKNPHYHIDDSPWKALQIHRMMSKNHLEPKTIVDVGCGAGEVLRQLQILLPETTKLSGYDISRQAIDLCRERANLNLAFHCEDLLSAETDAFDLLLSIDVIEHIEDYLGFLRAVRKKAKYKIFHIPLDISVQSVLRKYPIVLSRTNIGHLHYFTKETALMTLEDTGYKVLDYAYTPSAISLGKSLLVKLATIPMRISFMINQNMTARVFGGYSLMVLAE